MKDEMGSLENHSQSRNNLLVALYYLDKSKNKYTYIFINVLNYHVTAAMLDGRNNKNIVLPTNMAAFT
jgi:hypothetical protein